MSENSTVYVTPGHPVKAGAGYDCNCGECLYQRRQNITPMWEAMDCPDVTDDPFYADFDEPTK